MFRPGHVVVCLTPNLLSFVFLLMPLQLICSLAQQKLLSQEHGHCRVPHGYAQNRKLSWWVMNQRAQYQLLPHGKASWLSQNRIRLMNILGFDWNPIIGKS